MGSQQIFNARRAAAPTIVVKVGGDWYIAEFKDAEQPDQTGGGVGPVVLCYATKGKPYARSPRAAACSDAALVLKRQERE